MAAAHAPSAASAAEYVAVSLGDLNFTADDTTLSQSDSVRFQRLLRWIKGHGGIVDNVEIRTWPHSYERGVFARTDLAPGIFAVIPRSISFNTRNALSRAKPELRELLLDVKESLGGNEEMNDRAALGLFLVYEKLVAREASHWFPYIDTLPRSDVRYSSLLFATVDDLERWGVNNLVGKSVDIAWQLIKRMYTKAKAHPALFPFPDELLIRELRWSYYMVLSRAWTREPLEMIPFGDIMNHRVSSPITLLPNDTHNNFVLLRFPGIPQGAEVFDTYQKNPSPTLYGLSWGFVPEASENFLPLERSVEPLPWEKRRLLARLGCLSSVDKLQVALNCADEEVAPMTMNCLRAFALDDVALRNATDWYPVLRSRQENGTLVEGNPQLDFQVLREVAEIFQQTVAEVTDDDRERMVAPTTDIVEKLALRIKYAVSMCVDHVRWVAARKFAEDRAQKKGPPL